MNLKFPQKKILLIGDFMVDYYQFGSSARFSPEAPIPVINLEKELIVPGGAGNVAMNLRSLGMHVTCLGCIGEDKWGNKLISILNEKKISTKYIEQKKNHITTLKQRVYCNNKQQSRVDHEAILDNWTPKNAVKYSDYDLVILSDYNKGVFSKKWFEPSCNDFVILDPKTLKKHLLSSVNIITPNLNELSILSAQELNSDQSIIRAAQKLLLEYSLDYILVTRGEDGLLVIGKNDFVKYIDPNLVKSPDVTGAGDTVVSVFSTLYLTTNDIIYSASVANKAAAKVVARKGTSVVDLEDLKSFL